VTTLAALRADARACFAAALAAVEPAVAVARHLAREGDAIVLRARDGAEIGRHRGPVCVVGAGKAVVAMAKAARAIVGASSCHGLVIAPHGAAAADLAPITLRHGAHPLPDAAGVEATAALVELVTSRGRDTLVLVLLSGGGSALLVAPHDDVTLADTHAVTRDLLAAGADIAALNAVRKHCSRVTGGGLARAAAKTAGCWTLALSDVVGDDPATIASGPTVADRTTYGDALAALARHGVTPPASIATHLRRGAAGAVAETLKPGDPALALARTALVGRNADAVAAAAAEAARRGYAVTVEPRPLEGDAAAAGERLASALDALPGRGPAALVAGGETTVRARPGGQGGRSQHLALSAAIRLSGRHAVLLAAGTDGIDGPTAAAGACVDGETLTRAVVQGLDAAAALAATDSHRLLSATGDLVVTGPTGTNVADVVVALRTPA
jgi:glycerate-2-kinase